MGINKTRAIAIAALVIALTGSHGLSAIAKRRTTAFAGSVSLTGPHATSKIRRSATISWTWQAGSVVKSTSRVDLLAGDGMAWHPVALGLPIRNGEFAWDTSQWPDNRYSLRVQVQKTTIRGQLDQIFIDNTKPEARIARPAQGEILVEDDTRIYFATVVGTATLTADARDALTGISDITWKLDGAEIARGNNVRYNFSLVPGKHELTVVAKDGAGNESDPHTIVIFCAPGTSTPDALMPSDAPTVPSSPLPTPSDVPSDVPSVDPSTLPGIPPAPDPSSVPSQVPTVDPSTIPTPPPAPSVPGNAPPAGTGAIPNTPIVTVP